jgi:hypothetical protein
LDGAFTESKNGFELQNEIGASSSKAWSTSMPAETVGAVKAGRVVVIPARFTQGLQNQKSVSASNETIAFIIKGLVQFGAVETVDAVKVEKRVFGPAPLAMLRGRHRRRFLVKCGRDLAPQGLIRDGIRAMKRPGDLPRPIAVAFDNS